MFTLLAGKFLWIVGAVAAVVVSLHIGIGAFTNFVASAEVLKIANEQQAIVIEEQESRIQRLSESHQRAESEVKWARDYVAKQTKTIEQLESRSFN